MKSKMPPKKSLFYVVGFWLLLLSFPVFGQQQITLSGKVSDKATQQPVVGATVRIKGSLLGTTADGNGQFQISFKQHLPVTLIVTFIGYQTQETDVYEAESLVIELEEDLNRINEVVVVGYGTQKKSDITGSLSSISTATLKQLPVSSFDKALQGASAGVQVTQTSGQPGGVSTIRIRGGNSITGSNEPLYVIDGFPIFNDNSTVDAGALSGQGVNPLSTISSGDIESIDILKDASATAIYGSRGANGVVLITTKKGKAGENTVTYDGYYGRQTVSKTFNLLNAQQFATLRNEALLNTNPTATPYYTSDQIANLKTTDWQKALFQTSPIQSHNLSISGGDEKSHFYLSGNYFNQEGIIINTGFTRFSGRINYDRNLSKNLRVSTAITISDVITKEARDGVVLAAVSFPPDVPIKDANGKYTPINILGATINPVASLNEETNESKVKRFLGNAFGEYKITNDLVAKVSFGADAADTKQNRYLPSDIYDGNLTNGSATVGTVFYNSWLNENTLTYTKAFHKIHHLEILLGYTTQKWDYESTVARAENFATNSTTYNSLQSGSLLVSPSSNSASSVLNSYLGRINYALSSKYLFTFSLRADGSSVLGENHKWGYFPSAAFAWNAGSENFIKKLLIVDNLKVRLSAGTTGNAQLPPYSSLSKISPYQYVFNNAIVTGFSPSNLGNPDLKWETTYQFNGGVDVGLLDRISLNFDAYYKKTVDLLLDVPIPFSSGYQTTTENLGSVENKGIELYITTKNIKTRKDGFTWTSTLSYSLNRNKVLSLGQYQSFLPDGGSERTIYNPTILKVGSPVGSFYGLKFNGIIQSTDDLSQTPKFKPTDGPGNIKFVDLNGDKVIDYTNDRTIIGNPQPKFIASLSNNFTFKNFDLSVFFQGVYGNKILNYLKIDLTQTTGFENALTDVLNRWTPSNPGNTIPKAYQQQSVAFSDQYVEDGSYLRLKNITLGYALPAKLLAKYNIKQLRFYVTGQNLITWTHYSGYDPEVSRYQQSSLYSGFDYGEYPNYRTFLGGLSLTF